MLSEMKVLIVSSHQFRKCIEWTLENLKKKIKISGVTSLQHNINTSR